MSRAALCSLGIFTAIFAASPALADPSPSASGTGFFINADGWAVTNAHVLEGCTSAAVPTMGPATDWIVDRQNDVAVVKVQGAEGKPYLRLRGAAPRLGDEIAVFGYPLGGFLSDSVKVTFGNINSLVGMDNDTRYLQISAPIQPGNSGGPVVDHSGSVLGVASAVLGLRFAGHTGILPQNVNFAIRSNILEMFLQSRGVRYETATTPEPQMATADLAERVAPSVMSIVCFKDADRATADRGAKVSTPSDDGAGIPDDPSKRATLFAHAYNAGWSLPNAEALAFMSEVYQGNVEFYGKRVSAAIVLEEKRKFAERWPIRDYTVRDGSLSVRCGGTACNISATIDWFAYSPARRKASNGVATFSLEIDPQRLVIRRETGSVLRGATADASGVIARWGDQNDRCRGGSGDSPETTKACEAREHTGISLQAAGWCYGRRGQYGYQQWHRCD
jgi:hypothetical protein